MCERSEILNSSEILYFAGADTRGTWTDYAAVQNLPHNCAPAARIRVRAYGKSQCVVKVVH